MSDYNPSDIDVSVRFKVGIFTILGIALIGAITVFVNDRPFWWKSCQLVHINVSDATGLQSDSPVRSLGLNIGYLKYVQLRDTKVRLGICLTAPIEVLPSTRAYIRGEGFLGDKFVELKPVKYVGEQGSMQSLPLPMPFYAMNGLLPSAMAAERDQGREIPVGDQAQDVSDLVDQVDNMVDQMTRLTNNLKEAIDPAEMKSTIKQLNAALANASKTFSPEGNLTTTAQRTLAKLEDSIEQLRDQMTRVNQGKGSVGRVLNDDKFANQLETALQNLNDLLNRANRFVFIVDVGVEQIEAYGGGRGYFNVSLWPNETRYYKLGLAVDPRGKAATTTTTTTVGGQSTTIRATQVEEAGLLISALLGKVFWRRLDLALGFIHGDGNVRVGLNFGVNGYEDKIQLITDMYARTAADTGTSSSQIHFRTYAVIRPFSTVYFRGGIDTLRQVGGKLPVSFGAGLAFDDDDIKMLFSLL